MSRAKCAYDTGFSPRRLLESDSGSAGSRAARARPCHPAAAGRAEAPARVVTNIGDDQTVPVKIGPGADVSGPGAGVAGQGHKLDGHIEVETAESVNHLEAMAQWAHLGRARAPFHLYVPAGSVDIARRLCAENQVNVAEIWSYHTIGDQTRFTLVHRAPVAEPRAPPRRRHRATNDRARRQHRGDGQAGGAQGRGARRGESRRARKTAESRTQKRK